MVFAFRRRSGFLTVFILAGISAIESQQSGGRFVWQTLRTSVDCVSFVRFMNAFYHHRIQTLRQVMPLKILNEMFDDE